MLTQWQLLSMRWLVRFLIGTLAIHIVVPVGSQLYLSMQEPKESARRPIGLT